jgi:hypothetical protein
MDAGRRLQRAQARARESEGRMSNLDFDLALVDEAPRLAQRAVVVPASPGDPVRIRVQEAAGVTALDAIRAAYLAYGRSGIGDNRRLIIVLEMASYNSEVEIALNLRKFQPDETFTDEIIQIPGVTQIAI